MQKREKAIVLLVWLATLAVSIKSIFLDFAFDNAYQLAMSYRHLQGDRMFLEMWEPHQTSIFINDFLMWVYHLFVPSFYGVAIFTQIAGTILMMLVALVMYKTLKGRVENTVLHLMCAGLVLFRVKQTPGVEYSNMLIGFSVLLFCTLIYWIDHKDKALLIVLLGILGFLQVLSYPSAALTVVVVGFIILKESEHKLKDCLLFVLINICSFGVYIAYFLLSIGLSTFSKCVNGILGGDSHLTDIVFESFVDNIPQAVLFVGVSIAVGLLYFGVTRIFFSSQDTPSPLIIGLITSILFEIVMVVGQKKTGLDFDRVIFTVPLVLMVFAALQYHRLETSDKRIWIIGILISLSSFFAVMLLTDLGILAQLAYLILGGLVSFIPISKAYKESRLFLCLIIVLFVFHRAVVVVGYGNLGQKVILTWEAENYIHKGPSVGVICDRGNVIRAQEGYEDIQNFVSPEDNLLVVSQEWYPLDPIAFMCGGRISNNVTLSSQLFNEAMTDYFEINPGKYPTVIAVACAYGNMQVDENGYAMKWVNEHFTPVAEGRFWRFYR